MTAKQTDDPTTTNTPQATSSGHNPQKTGQPSKGSQGTQMGGKTSPAGGPETFESNQVNEGRINKGGAQTGRGDPYPPVNPERPKMAGGQSNVQGANISGSNPSYGANPSGGNVGSTSETFGTAKSGTPGLEEEE